MRQREHPLPDGDLGDHVVGEVGGRLGHASPAARGAEPAVLAREGDHPVVAASSTPNARGALGQDPAVEEVSELLLDESRQRPLAVGLDVRDERLEVSLERLVEDGLFGTSAFVVNGAMAVDPNGIASEHDGRQPPANAMPNACSKDLGDKARRFASGGQPAGQTVAKVARPLATCESRDPRSQRPNGPRVGAERSRCLPALPGPRYHPPRQHPRYPESNQVTP